VNATSNQRATTNPVVDVTVAKGSAPSDVNAGVAADGMHTPRLRQAQSAGNTKRRRSLDLNGFLALATQIVIVILACAIWQVAVNRHWVNPFFFGSPAEIGAAVRDWILDGSLFTNAYATLSEALVGFIIAVVIAVPVGIVIARSLFWGRVAEPFIDMANSTPRFALAPLFVLFFGLGQLTKVILVFSVVFFVMLINTIAGVAAIDKNYIRFAQLVGASRRALFSKVIVPATARWLIAGMRLSVPYAIAAAVVGEMISANKGLGFLVVKYAGLLETSKVLAAVVILAIAGWAINKAFSWLVGRSPWVK
jgi:NitT/TauT family transport system permease protein